MSGVFPNEYVRSKDFTDEAGSASDHASLNTELDTLGAHINTLLAAVKMVMRDDGLIANSVVHSKAFNATALALMGSNGFTAQGDWATSTAYAVGDMVEQDYIAYVCAVAHTSGTFLTDRSSGYWVKLQNMERMQSPQCRLDYSSTSQVILQRHNGRYIPLRHPDTDEWEWHEIPAAGITLSTSGLSSSITYYVYAYITVNGVIALQASSTAHAVDAQTGYPIMTGNATRFLVGAIRPDGSGTVANTDAFKSVSSYWNREDKRLTETITGTFTDTSYVDRGSGVTGFAWRDDLVDCRFEGWVANNGTNFTSLRMEVDGTEAIQGEDNRNESNAANDAHNGAVSLPYVAGSDGHFVANVQALVDAGTGSAEGATYITFRG